MFCEFLAATVSFGPLRVDAAKKGMSFEKNARDSWSLGHGELNGQKNTYGYFLPNLNPYINTPLIKHSS